MKYSEQWLFPVFFLKIYIEKRIYCWNALLQGTFEPKKAFLNLLISNMYTKYTIAAIYAHITNTNTHTYILYV